MEKNNNIIANQFEQGHKIIFEGPELAGKSYLMSQLYDFLEPKYNSGGKVLDGCHWFNCDVGIFGTPFGAQTVGKFLELMENLKNANVMLEKFHLTEAVYQKMYNNADFDFSKVEERLAKIGAKIILLVFKEDEALLQNRIKDRLELYPHYQRIVQEPIDYIRQKNYYLDYIKKSQLETLILDASVLPNPSLTEKVLEFLGEK